MLIMQLAALKRTKGNYTRIEILSQTKMDSRMMGVKLNDDCCDSFLALITMTNQ